MCRECSAGSPSPSGPCFCAGAVLGHCLVPDRKGKALISSPWRRMLALGSYSISNYVQFMWCIPLIQSSLRCVDDDEYPGKPGKTVSQIYQLTCFKWKNLNRDMILTCHVLATILVYSSLGGKRTAWRGLRPHPCTLQRPQESDVLGAQTQAQ